MTRVAALVLALVAALALAGCLDLIPGYPGDDGEPVPGPVPECDFGSHHVRVEVDGVDASLTRAGIQDPLGDVQAMSCAYRSWSELEVQGPAAAEGEVPALRDVDQLWLSFDAGLLRLGTNVSVAENATLRVEAKGPPAREANLTWAGQGAEVRWTEWFDDPQALHPRQAGTGERPLENATGNLTLPVNSSRNEGIRGHLLVDVNESRHADWSAYYGSLEGVRLEAALVAPDGSTVAEGNWTPANGTDPERLRVPAGEAAVAGEWTLRYQARRGQADPGALVYRVAVGVGYGADPP